MTRSCLFWNNFISSLEVHHSYTLVIYFLGGWLLHLCYFTQPFSSDSEQVDSQAQGWAYHCCGFSSLLWLRGLVALRHVQSSSTKDPTRVPCPGRQILCHLIAKDGP